MQRQQSRISIAVALALLASCKTPQEGNRLQQLIAHGNTALYGTWELYEAQIKSPGAEVLEIVSLSFHRDGTMECTTLPHKLDFVKTRFDVEVFPKAINVLRALPPENEESRKLLINPEGFAAQILDYEFAENGDLVLHTNKWKRWFRRPAE